VVETDAGHQREDGLLAGLRQSNQRDLHFLRLAQYASMRSRPLVMFSIEQA
jgi:hypothetical protein